MLEKGCVLKLIIEDDEGRKTVVPFVRDEITIGRQEGNTIRLTERNVSRRHARLLRNNGHILIEDLGSYNGIRVNGDRIKGQVTIADGDLIQIGDYDLAIQKEEEKAAAPTVPLAQPPAPRASGQHKAHDPSATVPLLPAVESTPTASDDDILEATPDDVRPALGATDEEALRRQSTAVIRIDQIQTSKRELAEIDRAHAPRLVVLNTDFAGKEFTLTRTETKIGRTDDNDVGLDHRSLSRTHCKVVREDDGEWRVIDMQSANGVMVNGEQYAQVALNGGDVIELGHVKFKFLLPGDTFSLPSTSDAADTGEAEQGGSKAPIIAVVATLLVVLLGGGGYLVWKGSGTTNGKDPNAKPLKPPKEPVAQVEPDKTPDKPPEKVPDKPQLDAKQLELKLLEAREAIGALDFARAEAALKACKVGDSLHPEATQLLTQLDGEKGFRAALEKAQEALAAGDEKTAKTQLDAASGTKLLRARYEELEKQRAELVRTKIAKVDPTKPPPPQPQPQPNKAPGGLKPEAQKLLDQGRELLKAKQYTAAINRLEQCVKLDPKAYQCHKVMGSAYGHRGSEDNNAADVDKGRANYQRYIELAPPDDPDVPKVQHILDQAKQR